ncbi:hypothetical protein C1I98_11155 [Spongiactinospora gelatinilytica]|uniref:Uncharacterized protein n=1 Tax=Spongiactinospora gelatinilytica TaxID=2666298 RepID=A0A2W2HDG5_9ACTN|nr:hypothetical protein [Spongiactinospora gelatinilytica]PZG49865.1 hypothetical protein C1I98_11155 [Spongiactinospora gelatinilytica]
MPDHPIAAIYVLGAYGWLLFTTGLATLAPWAHEMQVREAERQGMPRLAFTLVVLITHSIFWPVAVMVTIATLWREGR